MSIRLPSAGRRRAAAVMGGTVSAEMPDSTENRAASRIIGPTKESHSKEPDHASSHPARIPRRSDSSPAHARSVVRRHGPGPGRNPPGERPERPRRNPHRPLGPRPHLRGERGRPLLHSGLPRRREPPLPVRDVAAAVHRNGGRHPGPVRVAAGHRQPPAHVPEGHGGRDALVPPARGQDHPGLRPRHQRRGGTRPAEPRRLAPRVPSAGDPSPSPGPRKW